VRDYSKGRETIRGARSVPGGKESKQCWRVHAGPHEKGIERSPSRDSDGALFLIETRDESDRMLYRREERGKAGARHAYLGTGEVE
jgi:hypothetical protein